MRTRSRPPAAGLDWWVNGRRRCACSRAARNSVCPAAHFVGLMARKLRGRVDELEDRVVQQDDRITRLTIQLAKLKEGRRARLQRVQPLQLRPTAAPPADESRRSRSPPPVAALPPVARSAASRDRRRRRDAGGHRCRRHRSRLRRLPPAPPRAQPPSSAGTCAPTATVPPPPRRPPPPIVEPHRPPPPAPAWIVSISNSSSACACSRPSPASRWSSPAVFFLRYSIDQGWLQPPVRVVIGILVAIALLVVCDRKAARKYPLTRERDGRRCDRDPVLDVLRGAFAVEPDLQRPAPSACSRWSR